MFKPFKTTKKAIRRMQKRIHIFKKGTRNALDLIKQGRLTSSWQASFALLHTGEIYNLRRYLDPSGLAPQEDRGVLLLVPPLMVASEIFDMSPELSAVSWLINHGIDVWLIDFGAPEDMQGGMQRTLDDHITAISSAINRIIDKTGRKIHLGGYSQGGMFAYQCAAYRKSEGLASIITFGSPVNIHRSLPKIKDSLARHFIEKSRKTLITPLKYAEGLPGAISSTGFKILSGPKELKQILEFFKVLPDRQALEKREMQRRFLGGDGFVAWPGPALRKFIDEMIINNRMAIGGLVINRRTITLTDITCPIIYFVGTRDEFGRPAAVRSINDSALNAPIYEMELKTGHFGLVVGSKSLKITWPAVAEWIAWIDQNRRVCDFKPDQSEENIGKLRGDSSGLQPFYDMGSSIRNILWQRMGDVSLEVADLFDVVRFQLPRLTKIWRTKDKASGMSIAQTMKEQASTIPDAVFFLWEGQAFTYSQADARINQILSGLVNAGIKPNMHVGIYMDNNPDFLTVLVALNRMGAVAVLLNAGIRGESLRQALTAGQVLMLITDPFHVFNCEKDLPLEKIFLLGELSAQLPPYIKNLEPYFEPDQESFESPYPLNPGAADDIAMLIFTSGTTGMPKAVKITNRRWCLAALAAATAGRITTRDTVYCCLPLFHSTGLLILVGGAIAGGARLALAPKFSLTSFWQDIYTYGATITGYVGEMCRYLVNAAAQPGDNRHSLRLFMGNGLQKNVWVELQSRFKPDKIIEFYESTEGNVILVNLNGKKIGSVGRPVFDPGRIGIVRYNYEQNCIERDGNGHAIPCGTKQAGLLIARIDASHPAGYFDGYIDDDLTNKKILRHITKKGDAWFNTGDLFLRDKDGDYWFIDRLGDTFRWKGENVSTQQVAAVLNKADFIVSTAVYGIKLPGRDGRAGMASIELQPGQAFDGPNLFEIVKENLSKAARPRIIRIVEQLSTTATMRIVKFGLEQEGLNPNGVWEHLYIYDKNACTYRSMLKDDYPGGII